MIREGERGGLKSALISVRNSSQVKFSRWGLGAIGAKIGARLVLNENKAGNEKSSLRLIYSTSNKYSIK